MTADRREGATPGFLGRWSARKRAARRAEAAAEAVPPPVATEAAPGSAAPAALPEPEPQIDPADLPPVESIASGRDVQAFLQRGVPKALRQAALRRLWAVDPKIRDFREVADYDWDFNAPGYGALLPGDDPKAAATRLLEAVRRQVAAPTPRPGEAPPAATTAVAAEARPALPPSAPAAPPAAAPVSGREVAAADTPPPRRRRHGGATPR